MISYLSEGTKRRTDGVCEKAKRGGGLFFFLPPPVARAEPRSRLAFLFVVTHPPLLLTAPAAETVGFVRLSSPNRLSVRGRADCEGPAHPHSSPFPPSGWGPALIRKNPARFHPITQYRSESKDTIFLFPSTTLYLSDFTSTLPYIRVSNITQISFLR
jgi:hypothetical protein